jgi:MOSC domain-containing protein YiiM
VSAQVISVNVAQVRPNPFKPTDVTGMEKRPVTGPVHVRAPGPEGDGLQIVHRPDHEVSVALMFRALLQEPELLPSLLVADDLPPEVCRLAEHWALRLGR